MQTEVTLSPDPQEREKQYVDILDNLSYISYAANRGYGMSHDQLLSIGLGNDKFKHMYEVERIYNNEKS